MDTVPLKAGPITLGVTTAIITSLVQSLGLTLQRKSHVQEESRPPHQRRRPFRRGLWRLGFIIFLASNILGSTVQITTLPLVILAPLQASGLIFNAILASLILHEGFTKMSLLGTVLVSLGAGLIAGFGALEEPSHNLGELLEMYSRMEFLIWMGIQLGIVIGILVVSRILLLSIRKKSALMDNAGLGFMAISSIAVGKTIKRLKILRGCILGCLSGLISAHCLLLAKTGVELIIQSIFTANQFKYWQSWMIILALLILELAQLYYLNSGLRLCSTTILYPLVFCIYNIISILDGLIYYQQTSRLTTLQITFVAIGTAILLTGVLSLSWRLSPEPGPSPTATLASNPFATAPAYELFADDAYRDDVEHEASTTTEGTDKRRSRALSIVEVEGLKDLLGESDDGESTIDEIDEGELDTDEPVRRV